MSFKPETSPLQPPQYLDEVEALIGLPAYNHPVREQQIQEDPSALNGPGLEFRNALYIRGLRVLADARRSERADAIRNDVSYEVQRFNEQWAAQTLTVRGIARLAAAHDEQVGQIRQSLRMRQQTEDSLSSKRQSPALSIREYVSSVLQQSRGVEASQPQAEDQILEPAAESRGLQSTDIAVAQSDDIDAHRLAAKLGYESAEALSASEGIRLSYRRLNRYGPISYGWFIDSATAVQLLRTKLGDIEVAQPTDMTRADIGREAGLGHSDANRLITPEEFALAQLKEVRGEGRGRYRGNLRDKSKGLMVWSQEAGMEIVKRLRARRDSLPPHLIPHIGVLAAVPAPRETVRVFMKPSAEEGNQLVLPGEPKTQCYPWEALERATDKYGTKLDFPIDYSKMPEIDDGDLDRISYARGVQYLLVPERRLGFGADELRRAKRRAGLILRRAQE